MVADKLKTGVFFIPFFLLMGAMAYSLWDAGGFLHAVKGMNDWVLGHFSRLFSFGTFFFFVLCVWIYFSPLARMRIGGEGALPLLGKQQWFSVILCTTIAIGILFWGTAEPLYHLHAPPAGIGISPGTDAAARFSMSTMFMHWTFTPYSIYTLASLAFAVAYYNHRQSFSIGAMLFPVLGTRSARWGNWIDAISLCSLVAGMAASLGAGVLTISGGMERYFGMAGGPLLLGGITLSVVVAFVISSITGLTRGIKSLSRLNMYMFFILAGIALVFGPVRSLFTIGLEGLVEYLQTFIPRSLGLGVEKSWSDSWPVFYWANWLAWTPVTAVFLGRLAVGYTVREFINFNLLLPASFGILWMWVFSGNALYVDYYSGDQDLYGILQAKGPEHVVYAVLDTFPWHRAVGIAFFLTAFLSYVAGADANTSAMGGLCIGGISPESPEAPPWIKIAWGGTIGLCAWVMVAYAGIDGIKMASNLGGVPALALMLVIAAGWLKVLFSAYKKKAAS
ncbi:MAG: BCCT family transporter [Saprospiraceae bacterium]